METAINEITLVLFTTIAPAGVIGYLAMACAIMLSPEKAQADRISHYLVIPLVLVISGLIASATHLGTPANALYVLSGIGRSPLSNEVVSAVAFLVLGGVYWIASFRDDISRSVRTVWLALILISGLALVGFIAVAYSVSSVPTWNMPLAPASLWLNAVSCGPVVGLFGLLFAQAAPSRRFSAVALALAAVATMANVAVLVMEWQMLPGIATTTTRAVDLVPLFPASIAAYAACELAALGVCGVALLRATPMGDDPFAAAAAAERAHRRNVVLTAACSVVSLGGCFVVRFAFYAMHMTVGV